MTTQEPERPFLYATVEPPREEETEEEKEQEPERGVVVVDFTVGEED